MFANLPTEVGLKGGSSGRLIVGDRGHSGCDWRLHLHRDRTRHRQCAVPPGLCRHGRCRTRAPGCHGHVAVRRSGRGRPAGRDRHVNAADENVNRVNAAGTGVDDDASVNQYASPGGCGAELPERERSTTPTGGAGNRSPFFVVCRARVSSGGPVRHREPLELSSVDAGTEPHPPTLRISCFHRTRWAARRPFSVSPAERNWRCLRRRRAMESLGMAKTGSPGESGLDRHNPVQESAYRRDLPSPAVAISTVFAVARRESVGDYAQSTLRMRADTICRTGGPDGTCPARSFWGHPALRTSANHGSRSEA